MKKMIFTVLMVSGLAAAAAAMAEEIPYCTLYPGNRGCVGNGSSH